MSMNATSSVRRVIIPHTVKTQEQYPTAQHWKHGYPPLDETIANTIAMNTTSEYLDQ